MSHFPGQHTVLAYTSGVTTALSGQRLSTVMYKSTKDTEGKVIPAKQNRAVSLPKFTSAEVESNIQVLLPHIIGFLESAQDKIVREWVDSGSTTLTDTQVCLGSVIEYLEESNESGRLTKESVIAWFNAEIQDTLMLALAEKLGISDTPSAAEVAKVDEIVSAYREKISALSGGKTNYDPKTCAQLQKALVFAAEGDVIASKFASRLAKMAVSQENRLLDAL